jgi:hypothetical protein
LIKERRGRQSPFLLGLGPLGRARQGEKREQNAKADHPYMDRHFEREAASGAITRLS